MYHNVSVPSDCVILDNRVDMIHCLCDTLTSSFYTVKNKCNISSENPFNEWENNCINPVM